MTTLLGLDRSAAVLWHEGRRFDPQARRWSPADPPPALESLDPIAAARWLQRESGTPCRPPLAVIGPREAAAEQLATAEALGEALGDLGATLLTGGRGGVMEAACRGASRAGGLTVGLLPDDDWRAANPHVAVPLASGIGVARNALIARAALALFAVGGGYGTLSEIAFALQFGRPVFTLADAPVVQGATLLNSVEQAAEAAARALLALS